MQHRFFLLLLSFLLLFAYLACGPNPAGDDDSVSDDDASGDDDSPTPTATATPPPEDCFSYPFEEASYWHSLQLEMDTNAPCCFDFDGDGTTDNAFGALFALVAQMDPGVQPNATLDQRVQNGTICRSLEYHGMDGVSQSDPFALALLDCIDSDNDYNDNLVGNETFTVTESSFVAGAGGCTAQPRTVFDASVQQHNLEGSSEDILYLSLPFLGPEKELEVELNRARIRALLTEDSFGVAASQGELGGIIPQMDLWDYFNDYAASQCTCLGINGTLIDVQLDNGEWTAQCQDLGNSTCGPSDPGLCEDFGSFCNLLGIWIASLDMDLDGDGINDAISLGMSFESTAATLTGVAAGQ